MHRIDTVLRPHLDVLHEAIPGLALFDAHTHIGRNDPDGYKQEPDALLAALDRADARAAVFPMHEPAGYPRANDWVLGAAGTAPDRLVAYCRVDPNDGAVAEAERCLDAGARGIKLHPRAEGFTLGEPAVADIWALAAERGVPLLVHAGRGIPALGRDAVALSRRFRRTRTILAHAAISDLAWLWRELPEVPNLLVDTSWWLPADLMAVFALVPPAQVVWGSDSPYGSPVAAAVAHLRLALQAGLAPEAVRAIAGENLAAVLDGRAPRDLGPPPGAGAGAADGDLLLGRVAGHLVAACGRCFSLADHTESVALARLACAVGDEAPQAEICAAVLALLDRHDEELALPAADREPSGVERILMVAMTLAATPAVPVPVAPPTGHRPAEGATGTV